MALAYGKVPGSFEDPDVVEVNRCLTRLGIALRPGVWRVDVYPFLRSVFRSMRLYPSNLIGCHQIHPWISQGTEGRSCGGIGIIQAPAKRCEKANSAWLFLSC